MHVLLIFIRNPIYGKVKTRLARTLGDDEALRIYRILLEKTRAAAQACHSVRWLFYSDFVDETDEWPTELFEKKVQHPGDLGERMQHAFETAFAAGAKKAIIIGSDCPELSGALLNQAFETLDHADFVIGPVPDGGYYLLGMKTHAPAVFENIEWSTETVREKTLEKIAVLQKNCTLLPLLADIDTEKDFLGMKDEG